MTQSEDWMWLDACTTVARADLARMCGVTEGEIDELVEYGSLERPQTDVFRADVVAPLREAVRVRSLFDLDLFTAGLLLQYLRRIEALEQELRVVQASMAQVPVERDGPAHWLEPHA